MAWIGFFPVVLVATLVIFVPGLAIGAGLRLRGPLLWGFAPAAGVAAVAVSAIAAQLVGLRWSPLTAGLGCLLLAAVAWAIGLLLRPATLPATPTVLRAGLPLALLAGAVLGASRVAAMIGDPQNLSQSNDAVFHLNALRWIEETGSASSLTVSGVLGAHSFYPSAWHGVTSLAQQLTGVDVVHAANAMSLTIAGPVWTASIAALVWVITRGSVRATVLAALFSPGLFAFPSLVLDFGVLYPYALAVAIVPGVIALLLAGERRAGAVHATRIRTALLMTVATLVGLIAVALAQPAVLLVWVLGALILGWSWIFRLWSTASTGRRVVNALLGLVALGASAGAWILLGRQTSGVQWGALYPNYQALGQLLINSPIGGPAAFALSALTMVGLVIAVRRASLRWMVVFALGLAALAFVALAMNNPSMRTWLLSAWYGDPYRFVSLLPIVVIPLAAIGADALIGALSRSRRGAPSAGRLLAVLLVAIVLSETVVWTVAQRTNGADDYADDGTSFLSSDGRALLTSLPKYVGPDDVVLGNPSAGAAYGYALSGRTVIPRTWMMPMDPAFQELREHLVDAAADADVCAALNDMGVDYVLDFGPGEVAPGRWWMPGLTGFADAPGFEMVAKKGDASLWRVTACAP